MTTRQIVHRQQRRVRAHACLIGQLLRRLEIDMTLPVAKVRGFSAHAELCAGCPPELLRSWLRFRGQGRRYFTNCGRERPGSMTPC